MGELFLHDLNIYRNKFNVTQFVETGTGRGTGLAHALKYDFNHFFSIEIMNELYLENLQRFNQYNNLTLINKPSIVALDDILSMLNGNTLFWLDAHFPGADFRLGSYDDEHPVEIKYPLEAELNILTSKRDVSHDVFIIDDLQLYEDGDFEIKLDSESIKKHRRNPDFIYKLFGDKHNISKDYRHQGFWIITPKEEV